MQLLVKDPGQTSRHRQEVAQRLLKIATPTEPAASARNQPSLAHATGSVPPDASGSAAFVLSAINTPKM